jgi:hypothetical protein
MKSRFLLPVLAFALLAPSAFGITITGTTQGCFFFDGGSCTPIAGSQTVTGLPGGAILQFTPGAFNVNTAPDGAASAGTLANNFGLFQLTTLGTGLSEFNPFSFTLQLTVTSPSPGGGSNFIANITGQVTASPTASSVSVTFPDTLDHGSGNPPFFLYNWSEGGESGTIAVHVDSTTVSEDLTQAIVPGHFHTTTETTTVIPEPGTYVLLGGGLLAVALARRKRRA